MSGKSLFELRPIAIDRVEDRRTARARASRRNELPIRRIETVERPVVRKLLEAPGIIRKGPDRHQLALAGIELVVEQVAKEGISDARLA